MRLRVLIADDEASARERLRSLLEAEEGIEIVAECADGAATVEAIEKFKPDVVFLDVQMPELDGFDVIQSLKPEKLPSIVFVTAHHNYAVEAFNVRAVDYLLKPFDRSRFRQALSVARGQTPSEQSKAANQKINRPPPDRLAIRSSGHILLISVSEIDWIDGARNYARIHSGKQVYLYRQTLRELGKRLPNNFVRISKSTLVNIARVREISAKSHGDAIVALQDGSALKVTRNYREDLKHALSA